MQIAAEVRRGRVGDPSRVDLEDLKLVLKEPEKPLTPQEVSERSLTAWSMIAGRPRVKGIDL